MYSAFKVRAPSRIKRLYVVARRRYFARLHVSSHLHKMLHFLGGVILNSVAHPWGDYSVLGSPLRPIVILVSCFNQRPTRHLFILRKFAATSSGAK